MYQSYCEIKVKLDFVQVQLYLLLLNIPPPQGLDRVAQCITERFFKDMKMSSTGRPVPWSDSTKETSSCIITKLWSELFALIKKMLQKIDSPETDDTVASPIFAILCVVDSMDPDGSQEVIDMGVYALLLASLFVNQNANRCPQFGILVSDAINGFSSDCFEILSLEMARRL